MSRRGDVSFSVEELAEHVDGQLVGDPGIRIHGLASLAKAGAGELAHLSGASYRRYLSSSKASVVLLSPADLSGWRGSALVVPNPYLAYAEISQLFAPARAFPAGVDPAAHVDGAADVHETAALGPGVVVGPGTVLGARVRVHANVVIGADCVIEQDVELMPNVVLYDDVKLGPRVLVHSGAIIGADGFGYAADAAGHQHSIAQLGGVTVGADVCIGANATIDRGAIDDTVVEMGVKLDSQVHIGHNCVVGAHSVLCGCAGLSGSTRIGSHCVIGGGVGVAGDGPVEICAGVTVAGMTHVAGSITEPGFYAGGVIHSEARRWKRNVLRFKSLDELFRRVTRLENNNHKS